jgi:chromosome partitioning protein
MARQILFTSRKGGVGKSTLARGRGIALAAEGSKAQRLARRLEPAIDVEKFSKGAKLDRVAHRYDDVVLDTPGQQEALSIDLATGSDVIFLPSSFSLDDITPTLTLVEALRAEGVPWSRTAVVFCRTGGAARQGLHARSILQMNSIPALDAALPQRDGFVSLFATGRTGREAPNAALQAIAVAVDRAMLRFIETAMSDPGEAGPRKPMDRGATA